MFTGLIWHTGRIGELRRQSSDAAKLSLSTELVEEELAIGESIAVNGACLTVENVLKDEKRLVFHTLAETLDRTTLGALGEGSLINLERALRADERLGGHFVQGHVDMAVKVRRIEQRSLDTCYVFDLPEEINHCIVPKGSVALDGISLTVGDLTEETFSVFVIPHTKENTNLKELQSGDYVNLETDILAKYINRRLEKEGRVGNAGTLTQEDLESAGFY